MSQTGGSGAPSQQGILEVQGWFPDNASLQATIQGLRNAGHVRADASLVEDEPGSEPDKDASGPTPEDRQQVRTLSTGMAGYAGGVLAAGIAVASGVGVPVAAGAALVAGLGSGGIMERIGHALQQKQIDERDRQGAAGTLLLAMHVADQGHADEVTRIMRESGATLTKLVTNRDQALTAGVSSASWTG